MDGITHWLWSDGKIFGLSYVVFWTGIGWLGNGIFSSRFLVQWYVTEKRHQITVPVLFWWLSLVGSLLALAYAVFYDKHHVIIFANAFPWILYIRNLVIHYRHENARKKCAGCGETCSPRANYCPQCGGALGGTKP
jgi:lipid-A-disaccharide synthase-like uncharacterized protein